MNRRLLFQAFLWSVAFTALSAIMVQAQGGGTATISGRIVDPQNAVVPGATVTARNIATGTEVTTQTTSDGIYRFSLPPGDYDVKVRAKSFAAAQAAKIHIDVGAMRDVNFNLVIGDVTTTVEVTSQTPLIETTKTDLSTVVNEADMERLPVTNAPSALGVTGVNGQMNDYVGLAATAPGVRFDTSGNSGDVIGPGSFNNRGNLYLVNGGNISDQVVSTRDTPGATVEEVKEFEVLTNNYNAEYGQAGGVILNVVTKSGSNSIHGDYHFYGRGRNFSSSNFFYNQGLFSLTPADAQAQGCKHVGTVGIVSTDGCGRAPFFKHEQGITLGGPLIKDRTFWFVAWEKVAQGIPLQLNPPTGSVATGQPDNELALSARLDHRLTTNNQFFIRWNQQRITADNQLVQVPQTASPDALVASVVHDHTINGSLTSTINPYLINEARVVWHRFFSQTPTKSTLPGLEGPNFYQHAAFCCPQGADQNRTQANETLTWVHGSHTIKGGVAFNYFPYFSLFKQVNYGLWDFNNPYPPTDSAGANPPILFTYAQGPGAVNAKDNIWSWFAQDGWKIRPNLTLNYGLRYDYEAGAFKGGYIPTSGGGCLMANGLIPACSSDKNNFQPRLGLAWSPQFTSGPMHWLFGDPNQSLVSAGFGEVTQMAYLNISLDSLNFDGVTLLTATADPTSGCWPGLVSAYPNYPSAAALAACNTGTTTNFGRIRPISNHLRNPETRDVNLTIRRELSRTTVISIGYVGAFGFGQFGERDTNFPCINADPAHSGFFYLGCATSNGRPNPSFGAIRTQQNSRTSAYNGLILDLNKRFSNHFQFHGGYTFSKLIASTEDFYGPSEPGDPRNLRAERGLAYADARHAFNFAFIYDTAKQFNTSVIKHIFNDWQLGLNGNLHSGQPYGLSTGEAPFSGSKFFGLGAETQERPNVLQGGVLSVTNIPSYAGGNLEISPAGFAACEAVYGNAPGACPAATTFNAPAGASSSGPQDTLCGLLPTSATPCTNTNVDFQFLNGSAPRNSSKGDPYYRFDLSVTRTVPIRERVRIELRADFFNVFNHTNFLGFNGLDTTNLFSVPAIGSADFNANCTSCLNPFSGQFIGASGQPLTVQSLRRGRVSPKTNLRSVFNGMGDPTVADIARQMQLSVHVRW